ncbi:MAG: hypothetical protein U0S36_01555 [Candidatus Nanopelagicales bacterium]
MRRTTTARAAVVTAGAALALGLLPAAGPAHAASPTRSGAAAPGVVLGSPGVLVRAAGVRTYTVDLILVRSTSGKRNRATLASLKAGVRATDAYYSRATGGLVRFAVGRTKSWSRSSIACSPTVTSRIARKLGWKGSSRRLVLGYQAQTCGFAGVAQVGGRYSLLVKGAGTVAMAHELGHNLGLWHSSLSRCSLAFTKLCSATTDARRAVEYGDATDLMGGAETQGSSRRFVVRTVSGTLNPRHMARLGIPVPTTRVDLAGLTDPVTVTLRARVDRAGWNAASFVWGGRTFWLSYLKGTGRTDPLQGQVPWAFPPAKGQVVVHGSLGGRSVLVPPTRSTTAGPGFGDGAVRRVAGRVMRVAVLGDTATVTFSRT